MVISCVVARRLASRRILRTLSLKLGWLKVNNFFLAWCWECILLCLLKRSSEASYSENGNESENLIFLISIFEGMLLIYLKVEMVLTSLLQPTLWYEFGPV